MITTRLLALLPAALLLAVKLSWAGAAPDAVVVCYSGGTVSQADAGTAMASMLRVVERLGQWKEHQFSSTFTVNAAECRKLLSERKPTYAITSLGVYLDRRVADHWVPLVQPKIDGRTSERYRVVVRKGSFGDLGALKGHSLGGTVLDDRDFIARVVFAGSVDPASFDLRPSPLAIRTLRSLDRGELDAVLLNEQQFNSLDSLGLQSPLDVIFTSEEIPLIGVVANSKRSAAEEQTRFATALETMCSDAEGKKLCDLFGVQSFVRVNPQVFDRVIRLWGQGG